MEVLQEFLNRPILILKSHNWVHSQVKGHLYVREIVIVALFMFARERNKLDLYQLKKSIQKIYPFSFKMQQILLSVAALANLDNTMINEISQTQEVKYE